ncbi:hypothetical protein ACFYNO_20485 [Kitasatospora sp. NPDC006697]|uniref:hypothetical protein n=1 Tax=Kitasatospora sp. NPDC006697 TaxID=3364020 RepID=UPI00369D08E6
MADIETPVESPEQTAEANAALENAIHAGAEAADQHIEPGATTPDLLVDPNAPVAEPTLTPNTTGAPTGTTPHGSIVNQQSAPSEGLPKLA